MVAEPQNTSIPLKSSVQIPAPSVNLCQPPQALRFSHTHAKPLVTCGQNRQRQGPFLLALAPAADWNFSSWSSKIRRGLVDAADARPRDLGISNVTFRFCNAM